MIVDDEPLVRQGIIRSVNWDNHGVEQIEEANDGLQALEKYRKTKVDILITDIKMPRMNGLELIRALREENAHPIIIVLSGYSAVSYTHLKENNLEVPDTWEELIKICDTFNSKGITPAVMGLKDGWAHTLPFQCIESVDVLSKTPDWPQQRMEKKVSFADTPEFVEGVEKFVDLMTKYNTSDRSSMTYAQSNEYFFSGKSAMYMICLLYTSRCV